MLEADLLHSHFSFFDIMDNVFYNLKNPDKGLPVNGTVAFCGTQGSGKTLSAVLYVKRLADLYPDALICSNVNMPFLGSRLIRFSCLEDLTDISNDVDGVIYLIDEMHILFNSLASKNVDASIFELVSQERKQRKLVVGTTQVFGRLAKPFREQFKLAVLCKKVFPHVFRQEAYRAETLAIEDDMRPTMQPLKRIYYTARIADYQLYDTSQLIKGGLIKYGQ